MRGFLAKWAQLNGPFLVKALRSLAEQLEQLFPGSPTMATPVIFTTEGESAMGMISVADDSGPLEATVTFLDAEGHVADVDDVPEWTSDNETAATVSASEDGMTGTIEIGAPGAAIISVTTVNEDGTEVTSQGTITVIAGKAVTGDVEFAEASSGAGEEEASGPTTAPEGEEPQVNPL
jgi:hypothetical protein